MKPEIQPQPPSSLAPQTHDPHPQTHDPHPPQSAGHTSLPSLPVPRRRTGKIASLSRDLRDSLNEMLDAGLAYSTILKDLGVPGLTKNNLSDWHQGGYQDWLKQRAWLDDLRARHEFTASLLRENEHLKLHEATLLRATIAIADLLRDFDPAPLASTLKADPMAFIRLLNTLSRLIRQGVKCERQRDEDREQKASDERWGQTLKRLGLNK